MLFGFFSHHPYILLPTLLKNASSKRSSSASVVTCFSFRSEFSNRILFSYRRKERKRSKVEAAIWPHLKKWQRIRTSRLHVGFHFLFSFSFRVQWPRSHMQLTTFSAEDVKGKQLKQHFSIKRKSNHGQTMSSDRQSITQEPFFHRLLFLLVNQLKRTRMKN